MADVFISYAREDRGRIEALVRALESEGLEVWWDPEIEPGHTYRQIIEAELRAARVVVVAWSRSSIASHWVQDEAEEGRERGVLIPVLLEPVRPPAGFRQLQAADLASWRSSKAHPGFRSLLAAIRRLAPGSERPPLPPPPKPDPAPRRPAYLVWGGLAAAAIAAVWIMRGEPDAPAPTPPAEEKVPAASPPAPDKTDVAGNVLEREPGGGLLGSQPRVPGSQAAAVVAESVAARPRTFTIVFVPGFNGLTDAGRETVSEAARAAQTASQVRLTYQWGSGDTVAEATIRSRVVTDALVASGTPRHLISTASDTSARLGAPLAYVTIELKP